MALPFWPGTISSWEKISIGTPGCIDMDRGKYYIIARSINECCQNSVF
jgi:hypothetical protein